MSYCQFDKCLSVWDLCAFYSGNMDNVGQLLFVLKQNLQFMRLVQSTSRIKAAQAPCLHFLCMGSCAQNCTPAAAVQTLSQ